MNQKAHVRIEVLILGALLLFMALARFVKLDARPLTDSEATHALMAAESTQDESEFWPIVSDAGATSPLYHFLTRIIVQSFGATDLTTRLVPALAGYLLLLFLVIQFRAVKPGSKLIWLLLLGFSPVMLTSSRIVSGDILAAAALFPVFLIFLQKDDYGISHPHIVIALATGIGLTAGSSVFKALTGIAITLVLAFVAQQERFKESTGDMRFGVGKKTVWLIPVVALIVLSGFGSSLEGVRGFALALEEWLLGWTQPSGYSFIELMLLFITSEPLIVLFGIIGSVRLWVKRDQQAWLVSLWAVGAGLFMLVYRGRSPADLIWLVMPLSYLSIHAIMELFDSIGDPRSNLELIGLLGLLITFVASGALSLVAYGTGNVLTINPNNPNLVLFLFLALAIMGLSVLVFFGVGWSWSVVVHAVGILMLLLSIAQGISSLWRFNYSNEGYQVANLWWQTTPADGLPLIIQSLEHTAMAYSGQEDTLPIEVQGDLPASLAWALRGFEQLEGETAFGVEAPPVILTQEGDDTADLPADYIGQGLGIRESRAWDSALPPDLIKWWIRREAPVSIESWVLWVRADVASFGEISLEN